MKRIISFVLCLGVLLSIPYSCKAVERTWTLSSNKTIIGKLYKYRGDINSANASTTNITCKGCEVALYPTDRDGERLAQLKYNKQANKSSAWVAMTQRNVHAWGSGHSTYPTNDPWKWLYLAVR